MSVLEASIGEGQMASLFWDDLARDLEDPEFLREYITESVRIATVDAVINALNEAREAQQLSKADLARAVGADPATIRRLFSAHGSNPTLGTLAEVATALGLRLRLEPLPAAERDALTRPLREGRAGKATARQVTQLRESSHCPAAAV